MGKVFCMMNQKGGVGKTTTAVNLGVGLQNLGKKMLLIDLDPQANMTSSLGIPSRTLKYSIYDLLKGKAALEEVVVDRNGLCLIPSSIALSGADIEFSSIPGRELLLKEALSGVIENFDGILIDCPPTLGLLVLNALTAAHEVIIPVQAEFLPLEGLSFLMETVEVVRKRLNKNLEISGVVVTMYNSRQNLHKEAIDILQNHFGDKAFKTYIRSNISLAEAPGYGQDIFTYKPDSIGAVDYQRLCKEFIEREVL